MTLSRLAHEGTFRDPADGTLKAVYRRDDGEVLETTLIVNKPGVDVYCLGSHHYCSLGCVFCHLTVPGFSRPMIPVLASELLESIERTARVGCDPQGERRSGNRRVLLSFMGVGEPTLNLRLLEAVHAAEPRLRVTAGYDEVGYALATMMPNRNLENLTRLVLERRLPLKVHFSLHSPFDAERRALLPKSKVTIAEAFDLLDAYRDAVADQPFMREGLASFHESVEPVELHYTLIAGVNDSDAHLAALLDLEERYRIPLKFLRFNPVNGMARSEQEPHWLAAFAERFGPAAEAKVGRADGSLGIVSS
jgi:23S rRNA (adenine2503-C2)-methyltransferase